MELTAEVVVVGAGPAGAATALMLAPFHCTLLLDRAGLNETAPPSTRIGESLPAAARRLFRDMGLWESFQGEDHAPRYAARSCGAGRNPHPPTVSATPMGPDGTSIAPVSMRGCDGTRSAAEPLWWRLRT